VDPEVLFRGSLIIESHPVEAGSAPRQFVLSGDLDLASADHLVRSIRPFALPGAELLLHLGALAFIDSSGIRALLRIARALGPDGRLIIDSPSPAVGRVLRIAGADRFPGFALLEA